MFGALWRGEIALPRVFWTYAVLYGLLVNLASTGASMALFAADAPTPLALAVYFLPLPYNVLMVVAVWRSAGRFQGPQRWADVARVAVIAWVVTLTIV